MIQFHFCRGYEKNVQGQSYDITVRSKILEYSSRNRLVNTGNLRDYGNGLYTLKTRKPQSRVIIQKIILNDHPVHFVRDIVTNKDLDFKFSIHIHPLLKTGEWLSNNPLPEFDIKDYENIKTKESKTNQEKRLPPPTRLTEWLDDYKLKIKYDIFETEDWVKYALSESTTEGMRDKDVKSFASLISKIVVRESDEDHEIVLSKPLFNIYSIIDGNFAVLYGAVTIEKTDRLILFNGAHLETQMAHWESAKQNLQNMDIDLDSTIDSLSRFAYRAYPKWTLQSDDLWFAIQKNDEMSNLSLTQDQLVFFQNFNFPYYINGQAGSGKSTMLYYLFANAYFYQCSDLIDGEVIFLTENQHLLDQTKKAVFDLLSNNPEFDGLNPVQISNVEKNFKSFREFLVSLVPNEDKYLFRKRKYLDFSKFRELYEESYISHSIKRKYTAEECWFTIVTYIYGYDSEKQITSKEYESEVYVKAKKIPLEKFKGIEESVLPFYHKLIEEEGYWDKLKILSHLQNNKTPIPKFSVVICDEAQDFCRVELRFILKLSEFLDYELRDLKQIPIVFAGDPNQTVNPTGFREREMTEMLHKELKQLAHFDYNKSDSVYNPSFNYRSTQAVVSLANFIQYYRKKNFDIRLVKPQIPKRPESTPQPIPNILFDYSSILSNEELKTDLIEKIKYKVFIIPVDADEREDFVSKHKVLSSVTDAEIKTAVEAKGAEYDQVVLFGFGEFYQETFGNTILKDESFDDDESFRRAYFFNKLYVGITRAKKELIIIDDSSCQECFWKSLVNNATILDDNWLELNSLKENTIEYNPDSLNGVITSSREDALNNAHRDKEQGIYDSNPARLKVAANQFYKLGIKDEYYICLAMNEEMRGHWLQAAEHYLRSELRNKKLEDAAKCFFNGQLFEDLNKRIGSILKNINQDVRLVISKLMLGSNWTEDDIWVLSNNRDSIRKLVREIDWRNSLIEKIVTDSHEDRSEDLKRELLDIYYVLAFDHDSNLWQVIGDLSFYFKEYERAIEAWDRLDFYSKNYVLAKIELSNLEYNWIAKVIWMNLLIQFESDENKKQDLENQIIQIHESKDRIDEENPDYLLAVYTCYLVHQPNSAHDIGCAAEQSFHDNLNLLIDRYVEIITENRISPMVMDYVIDRWAFTKMKYAREQNLINSEWLTEINHEYKAFCKTISIAYRAFTMDELENLPHLPSEISLNPPSHIRDITIRGFRRFKEINLSNLGMYNLIVGDNNVGKTSILEALLFDHDKEAYFSNLAYAYADRKNLPRLISGIENSEKYFIPNSYIKEFLHHNDDLKQIEYSIFESRSNWNYTIRNLSLEDLKKLLSQNTGIDINDYFGFESNSELDFIEIPLLLKNVLPSKSLTQPMVPFGKGFNKDIAQVYSDKIDKIKSIREEFVQNMKVFIPEIERIIVDTESGDILIEESGKDEGHELHQYGEGANKLFRILVQLTLHKGKRLLIDEVDAGIHHTRFIEFWKTILQFAMINETQVFATTHNLECLKYFDELLHKDDFQHLQEESRVITLKVLPDLSIKAYTREFEEFDYELENDFELRGE